LIEEVMPLSADYVFFEFVNLLPSDVGDDRVREISDTFQSVRSNSAVKVVQDCLDHGDVQQNYRLS
jgi:hypothetical protein